MDLLTEVSGPSHAPKLQLSARSCCDTQHFSETAVPRLRRHCIAQRVVSGPLGAAFKGPQRALIWEAAYKRQHPRMCEHAGC